MKRLLLVIGMAIIYVISFAVPVYAVAVATPDTWDIDYVNVYDNALELGDQEWLVGFHVNYASVPAGYMASDLFFLRLMDGATEMASVAPTSAGAPNYGFTSGLVSFYFPASSLVMPTWGGVYDVVLQGNPTIAWVDTTMLAGRSYPSTSFNWNSEASISSQTPNIEARIRGIATQELQRNWADPGNYTLVQQISTGTVLTTAGVTYFTAVIANLRALAPDLFVANIAPIPSEERTFTHTYYTDLGLKLSGTQMDFTQLGSQLSGGHLDGMGASTFVSELILLALSALVVWGGYQLNINIAWTFAIIVHVFGMPIMAFMGLYDLYVVGAIFFLMFAIGIIVGVSKRTP
jgi:hypothetical protein